MRPPDCALNLQRKYSGRVMIGQFAFGTGNTINSFKNLSKAILVE
jgi:hypothetical protein